MLFGQECCFKCRPLMFLLTSTRIGYTQPMTVLLGNVIFLHVPKTGGTWMRAALGKSLPSEFLVLERQDGERHLALKELNALLEDPTQYRDYRGVKASGKPLEEDLFQKRIASLAEHHQLVSFVRHPVDWWTSFWRYRQTKGWDEHNEIDVRCKSENFNTFIENVIRLKPGSCSRLFRRFIGPQETQHHLVGTQEFLRDDLTFIVKHVGLLQDAPFMESLTDLNVSTTPRPIMLEELREHLLEAEQDIIQAFYTPEPQPLSVRIASIPDQGKDLPSLFDLDSFS